MPRKSNIVVPPPTFEIAKSIEAFRWRKIMPALEAWVKWEQDADNERNVRRPKPAHDLLVAAHNILPKHKEPTNG